MLHVTVMKNGSCPPWSHTYFNRQYGGRCYQGFSKTLELVGVGYRATKQGDGIVLNVGYSQPVNIKPPQGIELEVPAPNRIVVKGIDKEAVGSVAANIRAVREPEPYKGKGINYETERVRRKVGKTGK